MASVTKVLECSVCGVVSEKPAAACEVCGSADSFRLRSRCNHCLAMLDGTDCPVCAAVPVTLVASPPAAAPPINTPPGTKHDCVEVGESELAARSRAVYEAKGLYEGWRAEARSLKREVARLREDYFSLHKSLDDCERRQRPTMVICATILGVFGSALFGLCAGVVGKPSLGLLVGFIVLCLTPLLVLWFSHRRQVAEAQASYLGEELDKNTAELSRLEYEPAKAEGMADAALRHWEAAYKDYERVKFLRDLGGGAC
jgi:hypothetical protein